MAGNPTDLQNCLHAFSIYCKEWKLNVNIGKTIILIFGARKKSNITFKIGNEIIEIVDSYRFLGVLFSRSSKLFKRQETGLKGNDPFIYQNK